MSEFFKAQQQALDLRLGEGLKYVDLSSNILLGGPPVLALAQYEAHAQKIHAQSYKEDIAMGKKPKKLGLVDLKLNGLSMVTAPALMQMWKACSSLLRFQMTVEMSTTVLHRKSMMPHISDSILVEAQYNSLQEVSLSGCCLISDLGVCSLVEKCYAQLKSINISYLNNVTDLTLYYMAEYCGDTLETLNVSGCNKITNHGIIALCTDNRVLVPSSRPGTRDATVQQGHGQQGHGQGESTSSASSSIRGITRTNFTSRRGISTSSTAAAAGPSFLFEGEEKRKGDEDVDEGGDSSPPSIDEDEGEDDDTDTADPASHNPNCNSNSNSNSNRGIGIGGSQSLTGSRNRKSNPSLDSHNPFHESRGCLKLQNLEINGNYRITDPGVVAMSKLEDLHILSMRNLDNVCDSPLLLLAQSCRHLKSLDISGLDLVSISVCEAFAVGCYKLETFNCDLCNFTADDYTKVVRAKIIIDD